MSVVTGTRQTLRPAKGPLPMLLTAAVLLGLLAMHGLGPCVTLPGPGRSTAHASAGARHHHPAVSAQPASGADLRPAAAHGAAPHADGCGHTSHGDGSDGHLAHADATCAAGGVSSTPEPPALALSGTARPVAAAAAAGAHAATAAERAPPSLHQLQLLRI